jgi:tRNA dimethylallyltransferase
MSKTVKVLVGPTSSGKTNLAIEYCKLHNAAIISTDSRQIYKYLDIGTGKKPLGLELTFTANDRKWVIDGIEIYGYDLITPEKYFSAYDYAKFALNTIGNLLSLNKEVLMVGGTGFYIDLVTGRQTLNSTSPHFELRAYLESLQLTQLQTMLSSLSEEIYQNIDKHNKVRLIRAIENTKGTPQETPLPLLNDAHFDFYGLTASRTFLYSRADKWVEAIFELGLIEETTELLKNYPQSRVLDGLVYKTVKDLIEGKTSKSNAIQRIKWDIHAYIRRQQTWFKKNKDITWLNIEDNSQKECIIKLDE